MGEAKEGPRDERGPGTFALGGEEFDRLKNTWWGLEGYMRDAGRHHEPVVTGIVDEGFALLREGMAWSERNEQVPDWGVWMSLAFAQLYNTSMAAWELGYAGAA